MSEYKYQLKYKIIAVAGSWTKKQLIEENNDEIGGTDAAIFVSILYPPDGSLSVKTMTFDGRGCEDKNPRHLADSELFKVWSMWAKVLSESKTLDEGRRSFASNVFERIRKQIVKK